MHPVVRFKDQAGMEHDFESRFAAPFVAKDLNQEVTVIYSASDETSTEMDILWLYFLLPVGALFTAFFFYISTGIILYFRVIKGRF